MKRFYTILVVSLRALRRNVMRTLLTMLGIIIGVAAVIAMVSIGTGASAMMETQIAALGQNVIMVMAGNVTRGGVFTGMGGAATLTVADTEAIKREVEGAQYVSPEVRGGSQIAYGNTNWSTTVYGQSEDFPNLRLWPLADGSFFTDQEVHSAARVAVLGQTVVQNLFGATSPIGATIRVGNAPFVVIGVLSAKGSNMMGMDQDDVVVVPYTTAMRRMFGQTNLRSVNISASSPDMIDHVVAQITALLRERHRIRTGADDDFRVRTQAEITEFATSTSKVMTGLLGAIAGVSLLVGGIGIMNIMLVSVTERTREIGIRLAVGAKRRDVMRQFLAESVMLAGVGGVIGIASGLGSSKILAAQMNWPTLTPTWAVVSAFLFSAVIGVFFGFYPARKAARLDPIEALRYE
jgi:putative ABC transport system permease protein